MNELVKKIQNVWELYLKRSKREKIAIGAAVAFLFFGLLDFLVIKPLFVEAARTRDEITIKQKQLKKMSKMLARGKRIRETHKVYASNFSTKLPDGQILTDLLSDIENKASTSNVKIVNMNPKPVQPNEGYKDVSIAVIALGNMRELMKLFYAIESSNALIHISRLQLSGSDQEGDPNGLKAEMTVVRSYSNETGSKRTRKGERTRR